MVIKCHADNKRDNNVLNKHIRVDVSVHVIHYEPYFFLLIFIWIHSLLKNDKAEFHHLVKASVFTIRLHPQYV